jgi:hypothetical protein
MPGPVQRCDRWRFAVIHLLSCFQQGKFDDREPHRCRHRLWPVKDDRPTVWPVDREYRDLYSPYSLGLRVRKWWQDRSQWCWRQWLLCRLCIGNIGVHVGAWMVPALKVQQGEEKQIKRDSKHLPRNEIVHLRLSISNSRLLYLDRCQVHALTLVDNGIFGLSMM